MRTFTRAESREIDRRSTDDFKIPTIILMENACRGVADAVGEEMLLLTGRSTGRVILLCGGGNNGGDGLAAARHLHNRGHIVQISLFVDPGRYTGDALTNWHIVKAMGLSASALTPEAVATFEADLLVDALFGTGLSTPPRDPFAAIVEAVARRGIPVLAVDLPSGLDCDTGQPLGPTIRARRTVTLGGMKKGFTASAAQEYFGRVTVADIGCPRELVE